MGSATTRMPVSSGCFHLDLSLRCLRWIVRLTERKRIVITGMGVISPNGIGTDAFARALAAGQSGISNLNGIKTDGLKSWAAGHVKDFDPAAIIDPAESRRVPRMVPMAIAASREAMEMAKLHIEDGDVENQRQIRHRSPHRLTPPAVPTRSASPMPRR